MSADFVARFAEIKARGLAERGPSWIERMCAADEAQRLELLTMVGAAHAEDLLYDWEAWARPKQLEPSGDWFVWLLLGGRGMGKTRTGAEWVRKRVRAGARSIALVGPTYQDIVRYMVAGEDGKAANGSGILDVFPPHERPEWLQNRQEVHFHTGAIAYVCSAERPELRGPNLDTVWCDEPIKWSHLERLWDNIILALRKRSVVGLRPRVCVTTTPRPLEWLRALILDPETHTTHGATTENAANLDPMALATQQRKLGGTRQGAQELEAEVLGDNPDALFWASVIDAHRVNEAPELVRVLVSVDPAVSRHRKSDATGIVVVGADADGEVYVLHDATGRYQPEAWGDLVIDLCEEHDADGIVVERNRAGDLVAMNVRAAAVRKRRSHPKIVEVLAMGDKGERATPVSTLYQKGRIHHVGHLTRRDVAEGDPASLEDEMTEWDPRSGVSPNGLDALVHAVIEITGIGAEPAPKKPDAGRQWSSLAELARRTAPPRRWTI